MAFAESFNNLASIQNIFFYGLMGQIAPSKLSVYIYQFVIKKQQHQFHYATIAEVYHPGYLNAQALKDINRSAFDQYSYKPSEVQEILKSVNSQIKILNKNHDQSH